MTTTLALRAEHSARLDYGLLRRAFLCIGLALVLASPLSPDPLAFAAGALVPWLLIQIIGTPTMPAAMVFFLLWQWMQTFARVLVGMADGQPMARSIFGPAVEDAYWYMLAGLIVLALPIRLTIGNTWPPSERDRRAHLNWRPIDLFLLYLASFGFSMFSAFAVRMLPSLYQQLDTMAKLKTAALFLLFSGVMSLGRGYRLLLAAIGLELVMGFTGLLADFRGVFVILAIAAIAVRIKVSPMVAAAGAAWLVVLLTLGLFWTAVKMDYRDFATGAADLEEETQAVTASFDDRIGFIGNRMLSPGEIDWNLASYSLLYRIAYVDVFGSVIGVNEFFGDSPTMRQWSDALSHVFQPRFLFPDKPGLSDSEVFARLTRADPTENIRINTSISVGYLGENYADLQFPGMLAGVLVLGFIIGGIARYFMSAQLPWMVREAILMAFVYTTDATGVEVSLPKILGAAVMSGIVYGLLVEFAVPTILRWLDTRAKNARELHENMRRVAESSSARSPRP